MPLDSSRSFCIAFAISCLLPVSLFCRERITLSSGFSLEADSHQRVGDTLVLTTPTGSLEFLAQDVASIELEPSTASTIAKQRDLQPSSAKRNVQDSLTDAARRQGLPVELLGSVAMVESALNPQARSLKGAIGLMQLMPGTARSLGVSVSDVDQNAMGGAHYLRQLLQRFGGNAALALAAYNAGPGSIARFGGVPPYPETQAYISRVLKLYGAKTKLLPVRAAPEAHADSNSR